MSDPPIANPFPGLRPFETKESYLFFGREGQAQQLLERLLQVRLLAVVGTSGSGKSSLVRAGLVPYLQDSQDVSWRVATFRPSGSPIDSLAGALNDPQVIGKIAPSEDDAVRDRLLLEARLRRSGLGLIEVVRLARLPEDQRILIVIDQFEELFRFVNSAEHREDGAAFVKLILEATRQADLPIYVAATMRSDFIGDCSQFHELPEAVAAGLYLIPRMTRDQRRAAIEEPVRIARGAISRRLVNRILNDAGDDPDQLPIMQHALMRTWDNWRSKAGDGPMDLENYLEIGGMAHALSQHADEAFDELDAKGKDIARRMFQCLTEKEADNRKIRRATSVGTLADVAGVPIAQLVDVVETFRRPGRSFLMPPPQVPLTEHVCVDISHESLIRRWTRLSAWVEEEAESATIYRRLKETALLNAAGKAGLWSDPDLAECLVWEARFRPTEAWAQIYGGQFATAMKFLEESRAARDAEARRKKRFRRVIVGATLFVIAGLSVATGWALYEEGRAQSAAYSAEEARIDASQVANVARRLRSEAVQGEGYYLDAAATWAPPAWSAYLNRQKAAMLEAAGNYAKARKDIELAMKADPGYWPALVTSSDLYVIAGNAKGAIGNITTYMKHIKTDPSAYGNLILAEAMQRDYKRAIGTIVDALHHCHQPSWSVDSLVAPDVQDLTHGFVLAEPDSDFLLALRYLKAFLYAMSGDGKFKAALTAADHSDSDYPYSVNAYLAALNWEWLIVRGQGVDDTRSADAVGAAKSKPPELVDYGAYAIEGAMWARIERTRPESKKRDRALHSYEKFIAAYRRDPQRRYKSLAQWVERQMHKSIREYRPESSVLDRARALAQQAKELKARLGKDSLDFAPAFAQLSQAIELIEGKNPSGHLGRRKKDLLIDLLLLRANWRLEGTVGRGADQGGAAADARRVLALNANVADAYRVLAVASFDDAHRKAYDERALELDPYNAGALKNLADLLKKSNAKTALRTALALLEKRQHVTTSWSDDYLEISQLQWRLGDYRKALGSIDLAIASAPWQTRLYQQRRTIEAKIGNKGQRQVDLHYVQGLRAAAAYNEHVGEYGLAMREYLGAFMQLSAQKNMDNNAAFELQTIVRALSALIVKRSSRQDAVRFWQSLGQSPVLMPSQRQVATQEAGRLSQPD